MKKLKEILKQEPVFLNDWADKEAVINDFFDLNWACGKEQDDKYEKMKDINILFASYRTDNYEGDAFVLFEKGGKLYEVNGGHCSCYGLENQWEPEESNLEAIKHRLTEGTMGSNDYSGNVFATELKQFLGIKD